MFRKLSSLLYPILALLLSPVIFTLFPIFGIIYLPSLIFRTILAKLINYKTLNRKILSSTATFHSTHKHSTIALQFLLEGTPDIQKIRDEFNEKLILAKDESTGQYLYPELRQKIVTLWGYNFWEDCTNFNINDHIKYLNGIDCVYINSPQEVSVLNKLGQAPWKSDSPQWELIIVPKPVLDSTRYPPSGSYFCLIFRWDHSVCDAISLLKLFDRIHTPSIIDKLAIPNYPSTVFQFLKMIFLPFKSAFDLALMGVTFSGTALRQDARILNGMKKSIVGGSNEISIAGSDLIPMEMLKGIAKRQGVTVTSLLMGMLCGGLRQNAINQGIKVDRDIILNFPLPLPHSQKLRNISTFGCVKLPISEPCSKKRLLKIHKQLQQIKTSSIPWALWKFNMITGSQPPWILSRLINSAVKTFSINLTNLAWSPIPIQMFGYPLMEVSSGVANTGGTRVLMFGFMTYNGQGRLCQVEDCSLFGEKGPEQLLQECLEEYTRFAKSSFPTSILKTIQFSNISIDEEMRDKAPEIIISRL